MARILIVEDSPTQAERLRLILEGEGIDAEVAVDAQAALAHLAGSSFDMVISDIVMPGLSGYELCREIKARPEWKKIPVILLTTRKDPMDLFRGLECGADNFYTKPYDPERLIGRIRNILYDRNLRSQGKLKVGIEIALFGKTFVVGSEKEQILDLLISTFEDIVQANLDLEKGRDELTASRVKIEEYARLLESRVRSSEEMYRAIIEGVTDGIVTIYEDETINSVNPAAEAIFGYRADELIGKNIGVLVSEPHLSRHGDFIAAFVGKAVESAVGGVPREGQGRRKDGTIFPIDLGVSDAIVADRSLFIVVIADITTRKATEQQLRQAQKMEAVGQLTGGIAHDFNNLLGIIIGSLDLLAERVVEDPESASLAHEALVGAIRGAELTKHMLAFARRQPLQPKIVNLNDTLPGITELLRRTLGEDIAIMISPASELWPTLADPFQIESAIVNLAINARDAMPEGGRLVIETANATLDDSYASQHAEVVAGEYVMLAVTDSGTGMPAEIIDRAFEPFFTTKEMGRGSGLGLSMVYGFIKQSGGHVKIYSEPGHGTTVKLYLPKAADGTAATADVPHIAVEHMVGTETILVVEDDAKLRGIAVKLVRDLGYRVREADGAKAALAILDETDDIELLFTDVIMPNGTGYDLARVARERRPHLKVLFTTGYSEHFVKSGDAADFGAHLITKPYRKQELASKLRSVLEETAQ
jgi:PAS domain S-box-containing protein